MLSQISYSEPTEECGADKKLIFIIVPGYTGDHKSPYVLHLAQTLAAANVWYVASLVNIFFIELTKTFTAFSYGTFYR